MNDIQERFRDFHNPLHERSLTIDRVREGVGFAIVRDGSIVERGTFLEGAVYEEEEWRPALALVAGEEKRIDLYAAGIICGRNGVWAPDSYVTQPEEFTK